MFVFSQEQQMLAVGPTTAVYIDVVPSLYVRNNYSKKIILAFNPSS